MIKGLPSHIHSLRLLVPDSPIILICVFAFVPQVEVQVRNIPEKLKVNGQQEMSCQ